MAVVVFNLYSSQTGLTLEAQPRDAGNVALGSPLTAGFVEKGGGAYQWTVQTLPGGTATVDVQNNSGHGFLGVSLDGSSLGLAGLAAPGTNGGLPTADASNRVAGVAGNVTVGTNNDKAGYSLAPAADPDAVIEIV